MNDKRLIFLLLLSIFFTGSLLVYVLDTIGVVQATDYFTFLQPSNPEKLDDADYPGEVQKVAFQKMQEKLLEKEEELTKKEMALQSKMEEIQLMEQEIGSMRKSIEEEAKSLEMITKDWNDREKKITDLAQKVLSMPPESAVAMMKSWPDFDIIDVFRKLDAISAAEGSMQITPYLLTLFTPERSAEITRKMLLPPIEQD